MPTQSALGLRIAGIWTGCADRIVDRKRLSCPLLWVFADYPWLRCGKEKIGMNLSLGEYNAVEYLLGFDSYQHKE